MTTKRNMLSLMGAGAVGAIASRLVGCTNGAIDPQKVADAIKAGCNIVVPLATIASIINAAIGATVQFVVDLVCTGFHNATAPTAATAKLASGATVKFPVVVNGKTIEVEAKVL